MFAYRTHTLFNTVCKLKEQQGVAKSVSQSSRDQCAVVSVYQAAIHDEWLTVCAALVLPLRVLGRWAGGFHWHWTTLY